MAETITINSPQEAVAKKEQMDVDDDERIRRIIEKRIEETQKRLVTEVQVTLLVVYLMNCRASNHLQMEKHQQSLLFLHQLVQSL